MVADHIGTRHYSFTFTVQQGIDVLTDVIHHLETFDVTTIRASTPMFLLARYAIQSSSEIFSHFKMESHDDTID